MTKTAAIEAGLHEALIDTLNWNERFHCYIDDGTRDHLLTSNLVSRFGHRVIFDVYETTNRQSNGHCCHLIPKNRELEELGIAFNLDFDADWKLRYVNLYSGEADERGALVSTREVRLPNNPEDELLRMNILPKRIHRIAALIERFATNCAMYGTYYVGPTTPHAPYAYVHYLEENATYEFAVELTDQEFANEWMMHVRSRNEALPEELKWRELGRDYFKFNMYLARFDRIRLCTYRGYRVVVQPGKVVGVSAAPGAAVYQ